MFIDKDLNFPFKEGETYYMVGRFRRRPLIVELECHKIDKEEYDWKYGLYEKRKIFGENYPIGGYVHPSEVASVHYPTKERKKILNNIFLKIFLKPVREHSMLFSRVLESKIRI